MNKIELAKILLADTLEIPELIAHARKKVKRTEVVQKRRWYGRTYEVPITYTDIERITFPLNVCRVHRTEDKIMYYAKEHQFDFEGYVDQVAIKFSTTQVEWPCKYIVLPKDTFNFTYKIEL